MRDKQFHRHMISKRTAVHAIEQIAEELYDYGTSSFYGYYNGSPGEYDGSIREMVNKIKYLKREVEQYAELKKSLKLVLKNA